jgi:hypothetical protein
LALSGLLMTLQCGRPAFAAGTVTYSVAPLGQTTTTKAFVVTWNWTADASAATVPASTAVIPSYLWGYQVTAVQFVPGTGTAPTAGYSATITDANGLDQLGGQAIGILAAAGSQSFGTNGRATPIQGNLTLNISGNAVNSATGTVFAFLGPIDAPAPIQRNQRWLVSSSPAAGSQAVATKAAGAAGVRHVLDCIMWSAISSGALTASSPNLQLFDGAGAILTINVAFPTAAGASVQVAGPSQLCGLNIVGTAATSMTLQFAASNAAAQEAVAITGYDVTQ